MASQNFDDILKNNECINPECVVEEFKKIVKDLQCESCGKSFSRAGDLKRHIHIVVKKNQHFMNFFPAQKKSVRM